MAIDHSALALPKPPKRKRSEVKKDGRVVLSPAKWAKQREKVCNAAWEHCERCWDYTPLKYGHAHHKKRRGLGGNKRDDSLNNLEWLCEECHIKEHSELR